MYYIGHIITEDEVHSDPKTTKSVVKFPLSNNSKDFRSLLRLAGYYRRFTCNFSQLTKPMTNILKKDVKFNSNNLCQESFEHLKELLYTDHRYSIRSFVAHL